MDTTYTWHQGAVRLNAKWAIPTPLLPDEIFSSWLVRAALNNGTDPMSLTGGIWEKSRLWTIDLDQHLPNDKTAIIADYGGLSVQQAEDSMITWIVNRTSKPKTTNLKMSPWILALGSRNRRRHSGMQYCPQCLAEDTVPYYRIYWRFAWHVSCQKHQHLLHDRCPNCQAAIHFHKRTTDTPSSRDCTICKADLSDAKLQVASHHVLQLQALTDKLIINNNPDELNDWFSRLKLFEQLVRTQERGKSSSINRLFHSLSIATSDVPLQIALGLAFELLSTQERANYLAKIMQLMSASTDQLSKHLSSSGMTKQTFCPAQIAIPKSLYEIIEQLPDTKRKHLKTRTLANIDIPPPKSKREVERMYERLKRKMRNSSK